MHMLHYACPCLALLAVNFGFLLLQDADPKWNEHEIYRFLLKYYSSASVTKGSAEGFYAQATVKQLYEKGR